MLFLLTAAPIGVACVIDGDGDTDTEAATEAPTTETPGTTEAATEAPTTETPGDTTETPSDTTVGPGETTETPSDTTVGPGETTTGGPIIPEACVPYATTAGECYMDPEAGTYAGEVCAGLLDMYEAYGAECVTAYEDLLACLSALECEVFLDVKMAEMACMKQGVAVDEICFGGA